MKCLTPHRKQRRQLEPVREHPAENDHRDDPNLPVHPGVNAVVRYHDVSETTKLFRQLRLHRFHSKAHKPIDRY